MFLVLSFVDKKENDDTIMQLKKNQIYITLLIREREEKMREPNCGFFPAVSEAWTFCRN